jgi:deoxyribodipyrimidine photo-lyase
MLRGLPWAVSLMAEGVHLVWLKRDLRLRDHAPLLAACDSGSPLPVFVYEPSIYAHETSDPAHWQFIHDSLTQLQQGLARLGLRLLVLQGELPEAFDRLDQHLRAAGRAGLAAIHAHEETGHAVSFARDRRVRRWCRERAIPLREYPQFGVFRGLKDRDGWAALWERRMRAPPQPAPRPLAPAHADRLTLPVVGTVPWVLPGPQRPESLGLGPSTKPEAADAGESAAHDLLGSFLDHRAEHYRRGMSSPVSAWSCCSRLAPHLAYGTISLREVEHALRDRQRELEAGPRTGASARTAASLASFAARLRWHCHFIQKLEDEPEIEHRNFNRAYDGLREEDPAAPEPRRRLEAWKAGRTGYPMVDAVMRCLHRGGWINFRMRAMLVSFASHHLWLHWREPSVYLARQFLDFEPGIHFSQFQMQSGTTGINTVRIYSPAKQALDHDPQGRFIRRYVPELEGVPDEFLAEPWTMPALTQHMAGCVIGTHYPDPIVDHARAVQLAKSRLFAVRAGPAARAEARRVYLRHGSRKDPRRGDPPAGERGPRA